MDINKELLLKLKNKKNVVANKCQGRFSISEQCLLSIDHCCLG